MDVITTNVQIDSSATFDPDLGNNSAVEMTSVLDDLIYESGFEEPVSDP